jgi:glycosyltransferase involved in cell wall biosynthesis
MRTSRITPENTEFVVLCFEGPDLYSMAGGLGMRISQLSSTLAEAGFTTHLFFVGDPNAAGEERRHQGKLILHRWCQWISEYYPGGVYEGEDGKINDFKESIPWFVLENIIKPAAVNGKFVVILGEEWQTSEAICHINDALHDTGMRDRTIMFWNANNTFGFDRINWDPLNCAATLTTVSRYMKHIMWEMNLNPLVISNGIPKSLLARVDEKAANYIRESINTDMLISKVARWDPSKRWKTAVNAVAHLKEFGLRPVLLARGGAEPYGNKVVEYARSFGLNVRGAKGEPNSRMGIIKALRKAIPSDFIDVRFHLPLSFLRVLYRSSDSVLANSGHEPFGLVGLETMAAGGVAFTGCTGEDYAIPFINSFVLETSDPMEIVDYTRYLKERPEESTRIRRAARATARYFTWDVIARHLISKLENQARIQGILVRLQYRSN